MWVTFVREAFKSDERVAVRDALEGIASPLDGYGWSSAGIYSFWDPEQRTVLYIGLAIDLPNRFGQHVGLVGCPANACKRDAVDEWFLHHDEIGCSVMLQTPNTQPIGHRLKNQLGPGDWSEFIDPLPGDLQDLEGRLIEQHRLTLGARPPWNAVGGSQRGAAQAAGIGCDDLFALLVGTKDSPLVARRTIRGLDADPTAITYEEHLHTARMFSVMYGSQGSVIGPLDIARHLNDLGAGPNDVGQRLADARWLEEPSPCFRALPTTS